MWLTCAREARGATRERAHAQILCKPAAAVKWNAGVMPKQLWWSLKISLPLLGLWALGDGRVRLGFDC